MNYKNGREAKAGDQILVREPDGSRFVGIVIKAAYPGSMEHLTVAPQPIHGRDVLAAECLHVEDMKTDFHHCK